MTVCYLKIFEKLGLQAIPMVADTGPIGGNMSHEFVIISQTGESDIYFDQRILDQGNKISKINYEDDLSSIVQNYKDFYSASDGKFSKKEFDEKVKKNFQTQSKGIEVGHIFSFGTKYSKSMKANVLDGKGKQNPVYMGSYGIGISRLVGAIIESSHDDKGIIWPSVVAPFQVGLINVKSDDDSAIKISNNLYKSLLTHHIDTLYDDKSDNAGVKFSRMDLIGLPFQIIVGNKSINENLVELKNRKSGELSLVKIDEVVGNVRKE